MKYILTDIEGTTTSISFVHDELFPYSKKRLSGFLKKHFNNPEISKILKEIAGTENLDQKTKTLLDWIENDKKEKPLKDLQGLIWQEGYQTGEIKGHLYPDVKEKLQEWKQLGLDLCIYSSGSIEAQKLLFKHSIEGDLTPLIAHYFDTSIGHKRDPKSYQEIIAFLNVEASKILFLSDIKEELDAAKSTGIQTIQLVRTPPLENEGHQQVFSFDQIKL